MSSTPSTTPPGISTAYEYAKRSLEQQRETIDKLDTKAAAMIGLLGVVVGSYVVGAKTDAERWIGGIGLALTILCLLYGFAIRDYANAPEPRLFASYAGSTPEEMQELFLGAVLNAIDWNSRRLKWKALAINVAFGMIALLALVLLTVVAMKLDPRV